MTDTPTLTPLREALLAVFPKLGEIQAVHFDVSPREMLPDQLCMALALGECAPAPPHPALAAIAEALGLPVTKTHYGYSVEISRGSISMSESSWGDSRENIWHPWTAAWTRALILALLTAAATREAMEVGR